LKDTVQGRLLYISDPEIAEGKWHYYVVMNRNLCEDSLLLLLIATSQIDKAKRRRKALKQSDSTLVIVDPPFPPFDKKTAFQCWDLLVRDLVSMIKRGNASEIRLCPLEEKIPDELLEKLKRGIIESDRVEQKYKEMI